MAIRNKYFPGSTVSRYLTPDERSWDEAIYQSGKPVVDSELNLSQEIGRTLKGLLLDRTCPSGFVRGQIPKDPSEDLTFQVPTDPDFVANAFRMRARTALVGGMPIVVEYTDVATALANVIQLDTAPIFGGAPPDVKRTDFVFLEVWRALVSPSPRATATVTVDDNALVLPGDQILINAVPLTAVVGAPGVDQFEIGLSDTITAGNIRTAINDVGNSFTGICTASVDITVTNQVNLRAADPFAGVSGNAITLTTTSVGGFVLSGPVFSGGADEGNKPSQTMLYRRGNVLADSSVNLDDDIEDTAVGAETTKRVQIQYRIRVTGQAEAVNFKLGDGFQDTDVLAFGATGADVATYPFVPADNTTITASSDATAYGQVDPGLWIAGDGSSASATALGTVDGFSYAIPMFFVFRRNDSYDGGAGAGWDPATNTNGALTYDHAPFLNVALNVVVGGSVSDRPDGLFCDVISLNDVMDLRRQVSPGGIDLQAELSRQMTMLLDGRNRTWAIDAADKQTLGAGSGDVSTRFLVCNEVGRSVAHGGAVTTRGDVIGDFDHIRRRFGAQPVVERIFLPILPTDLVASQPGKYVTKVHPAYNGWFAGDVINIDLDALNATGQGSWRDATKTVIGGVVSNYWPPGTKITDVLRVRHDDGGYAAAVSQDVEIDSILGVGTNLIQITLGPNNVQVNGGVVAALANMVAGPAAVDVGSRRRILIELEITYPAGSGTTDTVIEEVVPDASVWATGPVFETDTTQRPLDFQELLPPVLRHGKRELAVEYVAGGPAPGAHNSYTVVSYDPLTIYMDRRLPGGGFLTVTDVTDGLPRTIDTAVTEYGSSSCMIKLDAGGANGPLSGAGQTQVTVVYDAQDPIPNYNAFTGYQLAVYFRTDAPQTIGSQAGAPSIDDPLTVIPLAVSDRLWTGLSSVGSVDESFPYMNWSDKIPVNADVAGSDFAGEWYLTATAGISISGFDADVGILSLGQVVPCDPNAGYEFSSADMDVEFRTHFKVSDPAAYRPTAMAVALSGVSTHKVFFPFLARAESDSAYFRAGEVLLVVVTRYGVLDADNTVVFANSNNTTCAAIYRTQGLLILASE